jgi:hypothetical protein
MDVDDLLQRLEADHGHLLHNPYAGSGAAHRRQNLRNHLDWAAQEQPVIGVGEAGGPHGLRWSGVPFCGEAQFLDGSLPFPGKPSNPEAPRRELSGSIVWPEIVASGRRVLLWNSVMLHPYHEGDLNSIRKPTAAEWRSRLHFLHSLRTWFPHASWIAIGGTAATALNAAKIQHTLVRHPAHGGATLFRDQFRQAVRGAAGRRMVVRPRGERVQS